jgi:DNA-binding LacI/PurR family transcriptional regulator
MCICYKFVIIRAFKKKSMKRGVTIKDIAVKLNMSVSTVSKALNNDPSISILTKERVKSLADAWSYIPNEAARHFKLNKTFTLGLIIPNMLDQFYVLAINGAEKIAGIEKYNVIISQSHEDPAYEEKIVDLMKRNRVDGVIAAITKQTQDMSSFHKLEDIGIPVVFIARPPKDDSFDYVTSDNEGGAFKATDFLVKKGHKRIGHIMGPESMPVSHIRLEGYKKALEKHKIKFDSELVRSVDLTEKSTFSVMDRFMKMKSPPTAFFTFKNYVSLDAIEYLKKKDPGKLDIIDFAGFGNLPLFQYLDHKPIASIEESSYEMGEEAARLLFQIIGHQATGHMRTAQHIEIHCKLLIH